MAKYLRGDIQGLRAVAVLLVMIFHFELLTSGGFVGVDVFFVISGYVIISMLLRESKQNDGKIDLQRFYVRRGLRLLPAVSITTTITVILSVLLYSPLSVLPQTIGKVGSGTSLWLANFALYKFTGGYFDADAQKVPLTHTWSLSVEEQFYFVIPFLLIITWNLVRRFRGRGKRFNPQIQHSWLLLILLIGFVSYASCYYLSFIVTNYNRVSFSYYSSFTRAWEFCVGALLAVLPSASGRVPVLARKLLQLLGLVIILFSAFFITEAMTFPGYVAWIPVIGSAFVIYFGDVESSTRILDNRFARHLGDISYSLYLVHWPVWVFGHYFLGDSFPVKLGCLALSYVLGLGSYYFVEQRFRGIDQKFDRVTIPRLVGAIAIPLSLSLLVTVVAPQGWYIKSVKNQYDQVDTWYTCEGKTVDAGGSSACEFSSSLPKSAKTVYLVGDSNMEMYTPLLRKRATELGKRVMLLSAPGCPQTFAQFKDSSGVMVNGGCDAVENHVNWLKHQPPGEVVLVTTDYEISQIIDPKTGEHPASSEKQNQIFIDETTKLVKELKQAGHHVTMLGSFPHAYGWSRNACSWLKVGPWINKCSKTMPLSETSIGRNPDWNKDLAQVAKNTDSKFIKVEDFVCPDGQCVLLKDGVFHYRDSYHLTIGYALTLDGLAKEVIER